VHAKVAVIDDKWLTVGSANLNEHSLFNDTEMNVVCCDPGLARQTRQRLWAEHLERPVQEMAADATAIVDEVWKSIARQQLERFRGDLPATHRLIELEARSHRVKAALGPFQGVLVDG
jgi:phosphatidylserine/phosphatidylglycerophosphate/cardiolipin synthase-like enzyme